MSVTAWSDGSERPDLCDSRAVAEKDEPIAHVEHYGNGVVKLEGFHRGGEMDGAWSFYRTDGSLMRSGSFDRGRQIGVWRTFDRSGALVKETDFGNDSRHAP
jgi:antitoxin component YwqK of YwqJK toxin-antitoxin module